MAETTQLPAKIAEAIEQSGIELSKAESIAANYAPFMNAVSQQAAIVKALKKGDIDDLEKAKRARIDLGKICSKAEAQKKIDKESVLREGRFIDAIFNTVDGYGRMTQADAKEIETHFEKLEAERVEKLRSERLASLLPFEGVEPARIGEMTTEEWSFYLSGVELAYKTRLEAEAKAKAEQEAAQEAERKRIEEQAIENERLKKEAEAKAKELEIERAKVEKERQKAEQARLIAEAEASKIKAEAEAKLAKERQERERLEAEIKAKQEAESKAKLQEEEEAKKAAKAPDIEKLKTWINSFSIPEIQLKSNELNEVANEIESKFNSFKSWALTKIN